MYMLSLAEGLGKGIPRKAMARKPGVSSGIAILAVEFLHCSQYGAALPKQTSLIFS